MGVCVGVFSSVDMIALSAPSMEPTVTGVGAILRRLLSLSSSTSGTACKSRFFGPAAASSRSDSLSLRAVIPSPGTPLTELLAL